MTEIPGITRPKTETEHALERANSARQAVLILADAYGAEDRFTTHTGRLEHALRLACVELHHAANGLQTLEGSE
jgi:hypothetical protein